MMHEPRNHLLNGMVIVQSKPAACVTGKFTFEMPEAVREVNVLFRYVSHSKSVNGEIGSTKRRPTTADRMSAF